MDLRPLQDELNALRAQTEALQTELDQQRQRRRRAWRAAGWSVGAVLLLAAAQGVAQGAGLVVFSAGQPALASDVNENFALLQRWIEERMALDETRRVRVRNTSDVTTSSSSGAFIVGEDALSIGIDDNEIMARNASGPSQLNLNIDGGNVLAGNSTSNVTLRGSISLDGPVSELTLYDCRWTGCADSGGAAMLNTCPLSHPVLTGVDVAMNPDQFPAGCENEFHEDEMRLRCCKIGTADNTPANDLGGYRTNAFSL